jgi:SAM-dependent methyltransferase
MPSSTRIAPSRKATKMSNRAAKPQACLSCGERAADPFYEVDGVPVHQVKLVRTRAEALNGAKGDIRMCFCARCGFVWNGAFDPARMRYEDDYESTQAVSPTFNAFHERLARDLIERFDLHGKKVIELGCGQGEFVPMLAELGDNEGYGFDRVIRQPGRTGKVTFIKDLYADPYRDLAPDFVCCKMTLEHVHDVSHFLRGLRRTVGDRPESVVFFMIPEVTRILNLRAFWDIYYEHCSYWSPGSLARAFRIAGFDPIKVWTDYGDQYVLIAAKALGLDPRERRGSAQRGAARGARRQGAKLRPRRRRGSRALAAVARRAAPRRAQDGPLGRRLQGRGIPHHARRPGRRRLRGRHQPAAQRHLHRRRRPADRGAGVPGPVPARRGDRHVADLPAGDQGAARPHGRPAAAAHHGGGA